MIDNAIAARVLSDQNGRASEVQYFDRLTKRERRVRGRAIVVAASCIDSTRILLNSRSTRYPNGIRNSNDVIGRYLTEQIFFDMYGFLPELMGARTQNDDGIGGEHIYLPRFNHRDDRKRDYLRGFGVQFWGGGAQNNAAFAKALPGLVFPERSDPEALSGSGIIAPVRRSAAASQNRVTVEGTPLDRYGPDRAHRISDWRERAENGSRYGDYGGIHTARRQG